MAKLSLGAWFREQWEKIEAQGQRNTIDRSINDLRGVLPDFRRKSAARVLSRIGQPAIEPLVEAVIDGAKNQRLSWNFGRGIRLARAAGKERELRDTQYAALNAARQGVIVMGVGFPMSTYETSDVTRVLASFGKEAIEPLSRYLGDERIDARWAAIQALGEIGNESVIELLVQAMNDGSSDVREAVVEALGKTRHTRAIEPLISALEDDDLDVQALAMGLLGGFGPRAVSPLIEALSHESGNVRWKAADALARIGGDSALDALEKALEDSDGRVRTTAMDALADRARG
jgi:HEAT repeat protein